MTKYFLNLTNGLEILEVYNLDSFGVLRLQSTACEQKRWDFILQDLDYNFLLPLALGNKCVVIDYSKKFQSRAIYQGLEWIKFVLNKAWLNKKYIPYVKGHNCYIYFDSILSELYRNNSLGLRKIKYFKKFVHTTSIQLQGYTYDSKHDGDYKYYKELLISKVNT